MKLALAGVAALAVLAAACNGGGNEPEAVQPPAAVEAADSARFSLFAASDVSYVPFDVSCSGIADYARRRSRLVCDYADNTSLEQIEIGRRTFVRRVGESGAAGPWSEATAAEESALATAPAPLLERMQAAAVGEQRIGEEEVRGETTVHYQLTVDRAAAGLRDGAGETAVDVWLADGLLRRISYEDAGQRRTTEYFDFGVEVAVAQPPLGD